MRTPPSASDEASAAASEARDAQRRLLARALLRQRAQVAPAAREADPGENPAPLSHAQEGLWFLAQLEGGASAYNSGSVTRLHGPLDGDRLELSLRALIARHGALRTRFASGAGGPFQQVMPAGASAAAFALQRLTLSGDEAQDGPLAQRVEAILAQPFDLARAPLLRAVLLAVAPEHHLLVLALHHIVADGWSMRVIHRELGQIYAHGGSACGLPELPLTFAAHAAHQRQRDASAALHADLQYWRAQLRDLPSLELPTDRPRPARMSFAGKTQRFHIDASLAAAMQALAQQHGATSFMAFLAAFQILLMRLCGQHDIPVGVPVAGRGDARLENVVGHCANTVVMRGRLDGAPGFIDVLQRTRATVIDALAHAEMPFDRLVAELAPRRDASRNPLYQASFVLDAFPERTIDVPGIAAVRLPLGASTAKFDLSLRLTRSAAGLDAELSFRTDLFEPATVARMAAQFRNLLASIVADPGLAVDRLELLDADERRRLLVDWNDSARSAPCEQAVHALFRNQARSTPDAVAVRLGRESMTYRELDTLSELWAQRLREAGVGAEAVVGLYMERSFALVVGMLAILKAGGAFLPLDPEYPAARLRMMLEDAAPRLVLTQHRHAAALRAAASPARVMELPDDGGAAPVHDLPIVDDATRPEHLAYIIYTSGSTGRPKGAQLLHRGLSNLLLWYNDALDMTPADRVLQKTTINFDASIREILSPLVCGAQLVLAEPGAQRDMARMAAILREQDISVAGFVPSALRVLLAEPAFAACTRLRYMVAAGEALDRALAESFFKVLPQARLGNFYGPSEATVDSAWYEVRRPLPDRHAIPIGRPVPHLQLYVLDRHLQPQPIGVAGELHVGGIGVGRGYLNRPELTAERFLPNPFRPGERIYRTGDLARWLADGSVEFIGRADHQVKLRGHRIELGEIESALDGCAGVRMSAVALHGDTPERQRLVAYVVAEQPDAQRLRQALKAGLPEHMIPATFVFLDALPRLPNGKLDRGSLPRPDDAPDPARHAAPRSGLESSLLEIWKAVLPQRHFGVHDNFFDLGGHSLSATQVASQIRATLGLALPLRTLFEHTTLAELAQALEPMLERGEYQSAPDPIARAARGGRMPVSFSQRRMWMLHQMDPQGAAYNMCAALQLRGPLDRPALHAALDALVARHEAFRTRFEFGATEPEAIIDLSASARLQEIDLRALPVAEHDAALRRLAAAPFDLARGPLCRLILANRGADDHALVLAMHHIIGDDWSWGIVLDELSTLYQAHRRGRAPALPPKPIDFVDYAAWQRRHIDDATLERQTGYWLRQLDGMSPLNLPSDTGAAQRLTSRGARVRREYADAWFDAVQRFSARQGVTPFMTLLAAFQLLLSRWCGQDDVTVGTPVANRTRVEAETIVGSLVNTLAMRSVVRMDMSFRDALQQVRGTTLDAYTHQDIPYDYLVERLREQAGPGASPELRVLFNVLNTPQPPLRWDGLEARHLPLHLGAVQFDLALHIDTEAENTLVLSYATELFAEETATSLLDLYLHLLDQAMQAADRPLRELSFVTPRDQALLSAWNRTSRAYPSDLTLPDFLAAQRGRPTPALRLAPDRALSHAQLWAEADRLAHALRGRGVQRGCLVGLSAARGPDMLVAQLAVLLAGAAYVPLDPTYPAQRLHAMAEDAGLSLLITQQALLDLWQGLDLPRLLLDAEGAGVAAHAGAPLRPDPDRDARPQDPAYVIYTSGSTGRPKGVVVPHRTVVNFLASMRDAPGLSADDVLLAVTTLSFDIAVLELLLPLAVGASIVLASREQASDGAALRDLLETTGATVMQATPSTWRMLIDAGWAGGPAFKALVGGESLPPDLAQALLARTGALWNMYGPTETTVWSTCWRVVPPAAVIAIGKPIANTQVHVLDAQGRPCPVGFSGEIHIGGDGVATGYLNRPDLSAERFIPDPFSALPGARLYQTGDRGRWRHDGLLEHQGRLDFQVKLRGHRIELGDIEAQLQAHPAVRQCLVMVREDRPGDVRLVAYVVPTGAEPQAQALRDHLRRSLPDYMLPQHYVLRRELPLLPNGKVDRRALPAPREEARADFAPADLPSTPMEIALARVWQDLLGLDAVSRHDNFFDLGGHSLMATRAAIEFQRISGARLETRRLIFETLAQLADGCEIRAPDGQPGERAAKARAAGGWFARLALRLGLGTH